MRPRLIFITLGVQVINMQVSLYGRLLRSTLLILRTVSLIATILGMLLWILLVGRGYQVLGHFPSYGDPQVMLMGEFDSALILLAVMGSFWGMVCWLGLTMVVRVFKFGSFLKETAIVGVLLILAWVAMFSSSSNAWLLD